MARDLLWSTYWLSILQHTTYHARKKRTYVRGNDLRAKPHVGNNIPVILLSHRLEPPAK